MTKKPIESNLETIGNRIARALELIALSLAVNTRSFNALSVRTTHAGVLYAAMDEVAALTNEMLEMLEMLEKLEKLEKQR